MPIPCFRPQMQAPAQEGNMTINASNFKQEDARKLGNWLVRRLVHTHIEKKQDSIQTGLYNFACNVLKKSTDLPVSNLNPFSKRKTVTSVAKTMSKDAAPGITQGLAATARFMGGLAVEILISKMPATAA